jgi:hypothetical protein
MKGKLFRVIGSTTIALAIGATAAAQEARGPAIAGHAAGAARQIVIYRCTDAAGRVTIQNDVACPKGTKQQRQAIEAPPPVPAYVPASPDAATDTTTPGTTDKPEQPAQAAQAAPAADSADATPLVSGPPPQLYACRTWDERDLLTEDATPAERCAPLQVVAADGSTRGDAAACEKVTDQCEAVPAESLCTAWQRRVDEAEFRWRFAGAKQDDDRRREYERLEATLARSDCAP